MLYNFLQARYPEFHLSIVNRGVGGDTTRIYSTLAADVIEEHPDWLSVGIGINDVWRAFGDTPRRLSPLMNTRLPCATCWIGLLATTRARASL